MNDFLNIFRFLFIVMLCACEPARDQPPASNEQGHETSGEHDEGEGHEEHGEEEGVVKLSEQALSRSEIQLGEAERGVLESGLALPAEVQLNPDRVAHISTLVGAQLLSVDATLGDRVEAGQALAKVRSVELGQARAELNRATAMRDVARQTRERQRRLRDEGITSERSLLDAELGFEQAEAEREAALSRLRVFGVRGGSGPDMTLESPIAGVVVERHATRGENVSPEDTIFIIADLSRVWVIGRVYEPQVARVRLGSAATLTLAAYPSRSWRGKIDYVGATLDEETRTLPVRVELDDPEGVLRPGLFGTLRIGGEGEASEEGVVVPQQALQELEGRTVVFVPGEAPGEFMARPVTVGREGPQQAEVLEGVSAGEKIVVRGAFILKSELMRAELGHGHAH